MVAIFLRGRADEAKLATFQLSGNFREIHFLTTNNMLLQPGESDTVLVENRNP